MSSTPACARASTRSARCLAACTLRRWPHVGCSPRSALAQGCPGSSRDPRRWARRGAARRRDRGGCLLLLSGGAAERRQAAADAAVVVRLNLTDDRLSWTVTDNGPGFAGSVNGGSGLVGMRDRARRPRRRPEGRVRRSRYGRPRHPAPRPHSFQLTAPRDTRTPSSSATIQMLLTRPSTSVRRSITRTSNGWPAGWQRPQGGGHRAHLPAAHPEGQSHLVTRFERVQYDVLGVLQHRLHHSGPSNQIRSRELAAVHGHRVVIELAEF